MYKNNKTRKSHVHNSVFHLFTVLICRSPYCNPLVCHTLILCCAPPEYLDPHSGSLSHQSDPYLTHLWKYHVHTGSVRCFITARKRSLGQGNIFRSVCQEFCPQGGVLPPGGGTSSGVLPPVGGGCFLPGVLPPGGCFLRGVGVLPPGEGGCFLWGGVASSRPPSRTATATSGTHPTGMHSCSFILSSAPSSFLST